MYIVNRGTALYGGRPQHPGAVWGDDVLIENPGLQLDFSAIAVTYLWVFSLDGRGLLAGINKFHESARALKAIARRWMIRRAVVRHAERLCHAEGTRFRGRVYPIYAKEIKAMITLRRQHTQPSPVQAVRLSRISRLSTLSGISRGVSERISHGGKQLINWPRRRDNHKAEEDLEDPSQSTSTRKIKSKRRGSTAGNSSAMKAAANYGLHLRAEQMRGKADDDDREVRIDQIASEIAQLKADMSEVLSLLRSGQRPVAATPVAATPVAVTPAAAAAALASSSKRVDGPPPPVITPGD